MNGFTLYDDDDEPDFDEDDEFDDEDEDDEEEEDEEDDGVERWQVMDSPKVRAPLDFGPLTCLD